MPNLTPQSAFLLLLSFFALGALGSLLLSRYDRPASYWNGFFAILGSLWGLTFALTELCASRALVFKCHSTIFPLLSLVFKIDKLSAFFILVICLIAFFCSLYGFGYLKHYYGRYNLGNLGFFYHWFILAMILVVSASNGLFFLMVWEIMSVASYFLVIYERGEEKNVKAGFMYLVMTHMATVFILVAMLLLYKYTGSFDFEAVKAGSALIPLGVKNTVFILALIGFGTKAGIIPFHIWLPGAHPAAPSHVSGLMSGVMIKTGIYMLIRIFLDLLSPIPLWWGLTLLIIGGVSSLLGVLYALTEHDIKRLLAYHSIENIGIILLGLGSSFSFMALGMPSLALLGLVASLFHTLNHATFKSLLFFSAGSVINETHTRNMEEYGGLIKNMPQTALFFLVGSMAISALPPFNGFFSEWLTFQTLFQGIAALSVWAKWVFAGAAGALAFTGGLALACFVKAFGVTFLARPRSVETGHAHESSFSMLLAMGILAGVTLLLGIFSGEMTALLNGVGKDLSVFNGIDPIVTACCAQTLSVGSFARVSAPLLLIGLLGALLIVFLAVKYLVCPRQQVSRGLTWDCGTDLTPRMEITATGFARTIVTVFKGVLKPGLSNVSEYLDEEHRYVPKSRTVTLSITDLYRLYLYKPLEKLAAILSQRAKGIQSGNINAYVLYILLALLIALLMIK